MSDSWLERLTTPACDFSKSVRPWSSCHACRQRSKLRFFETNTSQPSNQDLLPVDATEAQAKRLLDGVGFLPAACSGMTAIHALSTASTSSIALTAFGAVVFSIVLSSTMGLLGNKRWKPQGKRVFITGGSQGLGLAVAELLASKGAHVTICSRTESKLREAVAKVKVSGASFVPCSRFRYSTEKTFELVGLRLTDALTVRVPSTGCCKVGPTDDRIRRRRRVNVRRSQEGHRVM